MERQPAHAARSHLAILSGGKDRTLHDAANGPRREERPTLAWRSPRPILIAFGVALFALVMWAVTSDFGMGALRRLPAQQRAGVAERALGNLRQVCKAKDHPRDFCREQATLLLSLPECDQACMTEARGALVTDSALK